MADDEELDIGDSDVGASAPAKKGGGLGSLLPVLLKWIAIVVGAIILIVTVVVVTVNILNKNSPTQAVIPASEEYIGTREVLEWYNSIGQIRTKTLDSTPASVLVEVALGYKVGDKATSAEITARQIEIKSFLRRYFSEKTVAELRPQNEDKLRIEIRNSINDNILSSSKIKEVTFLTYDVIEQ